MVFALKMAFLEGFFEIWVGEGGGEQLGRLFYLKIQCIIDRNKNPSENKSHIKKRRACSKVVALEGVQ